MRRKKLYNNGTNCIGIKNGMYKKTNKLKKGWPMIASDYNL